MKQKTQKALMWGIPVLILLLLGIFFYWKHYAASGPVTSNLPNPEFEAQQVQETQAAGQSRGIQIPGYSIIPVQADTTDVKVDLYNPEGNEVYFQISFILKDTGEVLYESKLIQPGQHLYDITLNQPLAAGDYDITIQYATFSTDGSYTPRNGANMDCVIRAGN